MIYLYCTVLYYCNGIWNILIILVSSTVDAAAVNEATARVEVETQTQTQNRTEEGDGDTI